MNDLKVIVAPDIRLNQISKSINYIEKNISIVLDKMLECMYKNNVRIKFRMYKKMYV